MKQIVRTITLLFLLACPSLLKAQTASFTASTTSGCGPLFVLFNDASTGTSGLCTHSWTITYHSPTSGAVIVAGPTTPSYATIYSYVFTDTGSYDVKETVQCGSSAPLVTTMTNYITVNPSPVISFTTTNPAADTMYQCAPRTVTFLNTSTYNTSCSANWTWHITSDFLDYTVTGAGPVTYTFTTPGLYTVSLVYAAAGCGCYGSVYNENYIKIQANPVASYPPHDTVICSAPGTVCFGNTSTGATNYTWFFGDGTSVSTTSTSPVCHTYTTSGTYHTILYAYSSAGCLDTAQSATVAVNHLTAAIYRSIDTICQFGCASFADSAIGASGAYSNVWTLMDATGTSLAGTDTADAICFNSYGVDTVVGTITDNFGCNASVSHLVFVRPAPVIGGGITTLGTDHLYRCSGLDTIHLLPPLPITASGTYHWAWHFGGGLVVAGSGASSGTGTPPISPLVTHAYSVSASPTFWVSDAHGCQDSVTQSNIIQIGPAHGSMTISADSGCIPRPVAIHQTIVGGHTSKIDSIWFTDGSPTVIAPTPLNADTTILHTFITGGTFWVYAHWTLPDSLGGCSGIDSASIYLGAHHPNGHITATDTMLFPLPFPSAVSGGTDSVCPRTTIRFASNCTNCNFIHWDVYNGSAHNLDTAHATSAYFPDPTPTSIDSFNVQLIMDDSGCVDTINHGIFVFPPSRATHPIFHQQVCTTDDSFSFHNNTIPVGLGESWVVTNSSGLHDTLHGSTVYYSFHHHYGSYLIYYIDSGGLTARGCTNWDSVRFNYQPIIDTFRTVRPGDSTFAWDTVICQLQTLNFEGPLNPNGNLYASYIWGFGDGTGSTVITGSTTSHQYSTAGYYTDSLTIVSNYNNLCRYGPVIHHVRVTGPHGGFTASPSLICSGGTISFVDVNSDPGAIVTSRVWNFNGGMPPAASAPTPASAYYTGSAGATVTATFPEGSYLISLSDTDNIGCPSYDTMRIRSVHPHPYFYSSDSMLHGCMGHVYHFHDTNTHCSYSWNFGAGWTIPSPTAQDTTYTYTSTGAFDVSVRIFTNGTGGFPSGCNDSLTRHGYVHIYPLNVGMTLLSPALAICPPLNIIALNNTSPYSGNTYYWTVTPPAGAPSVFSSSPTFLSTSYASPSGTYTVMLTGYNALGCRDSAIQTVSLQAPSGILTVTTDSGCAPTNVCFHYTDTTGSVFTGSFIWDFGAAGALISATPDTCFLYTAPGTYAPPTVLITTSSCAVQVLSYDSIKIFPVPVVNVTHPGLLCHGQKVELVATGADSYSWTASNGGLSCFTCDSMLVSPTVFDTIVVTGTTIHGCQDTGYTVIRIDSALHVRVHGLDSVCIGGCDKIYVTGISGGTYTWSTVPGISCSICDTNVICPTATHTYFVVGQDLDGCKDSTSFTVTVHYPPVVTVSPDPMYVCKPAGKQMTASVDAASVSATFLWKPRLGLSCDSCANPVANPTGNTIYSVVATSKWGCKDSITVPVTVYDTTATSIRPDTTICYGDRALLWATGGIGYLWMPDSGKISNPNGYATYVQPAHTTVFTVNITENVCFSNTLSMTVTVIPTPGLHMPPGQSILAGNTIQLIPTMTTPQNVSYLWTPADSTISCFDCPHPFVTPTVSPTTYVLNVSTIEGCHAEDSVTIHLFCQSSQIFIPNTFTPNGDGVNDWFYVSGKGLGLVKRMSIYNRWGQIVYEAHDINANNPGEGWNGTFNGAILEPDVFVYIIDVLCETGEPYSFKGDITLMR